MRRLIDWRINISFLKTSEILETKKLNENQFYILVSYLLTGGPWVISLSEYPSNIRSYLQKKIHADLEHLQLCHIYNL